MDLEEGQASPVQRGLSKGVTGRVRVAQFNDPGTLRAALEPGDVALVLTEPAMTNTIHLLLPEPGWHEALRDLTRRYGTLLGIDETHTHVVGPGGATALWQLRPDMVTIGKAVAGGLPMGAYGVTAELGEQLDAGRNVAIGGGREGGADRGTGPRRLCARSRAWQRARRRHRGRDQIGRPAVDSDPARPPLRAVVWPMPRTGVQAHALTDNQSGYARGRTASPGPAQTGWRCRRVIGERIGWPYSDRTLRVKVAELRTTWKPLRRGWAARSTGWSWERCRGRGRGRGSPSRSRRKARVCVRRCPGRGRRCCCEPPGGGCSRSSSAARECTPSSLPGRRFLRCHACASLPVEAGGR